MWSGGGDGRWILHCLSELNPPIPHEHVMCIHGLKVIFGWGCRLVECLPSTHGALGSVLGTERETGALHHSNLLLRKWSPED